MSERKRRGIYYTSQILADFLANSALDAVLADEPRSLATSTLEVSLEQRQQRLGEVKVIDLACGSGAFLCEQLPHASPRVVAVAGTLWSRCAVPLLRTYLAETQHCRNPGSCGTHCTGAICCRRRRTLKAGTFGRRSARKGEKVANLSDNLVVGDSLAVGRLLKLLPGGLGAYDLVLGNPPWGSEIDPAVTTRSVSKLSNLIASRDGIRWELFLHLGLAFLKPGGRLALFFWDTFFSPIKDRSTPTSARSRHG